MKMTGSRARGKGVSLFLLLWTFPALSGSDLVVSKIIPLAGETYHVQGIEIEGSRLWVTSVDKIGRRGLLAEYSLPGGHLVRSVQIQDGDRYHPGGLTSDGDSLWIPVAEYKRNSKSVLQKRSKRTLEVEATFAVADHIGAVALTPEGLVGANWDARDLYLWDKHGKQIRKVPNPSSIAFQDMKYVDRDLVGSGLAADKSGAIVWMEWPSLRVSRRVIAGHTDRGIAYTQEGMTIRKGKLWLLPEDGPSRLFVFELP